MYWFLILSCQPTTKVNQNSTVDTFDIFSQVDPFIGTGGVGYEVGCSYPGAGLPFGMVKVSPDTSDAFGFAAGFYRGGGYHYDDTYIEGFSHLHLQGTGITDYGIIATMPLNGLSIEKTHRSGYRQEFSHEKESAQPGYYAVNLPSADVQLSVSHRTALHSYAFVEDNTEPHLLLDIGHGLGNGKVLDASIDYDPEIEAWSGSLYYDGEMSEPFWMHFHLRFEEAPQSWGYWLDDEFIDGVEQVTTSNEDGAHIGVWFEFQPQDLAQLRVALSAVDTNGARNNWETEHQGWTIGEEKERAEEVWRTFFDRIQLSGGSEEEQIRFSSALYRSLLMPNLFSDADGRYLGFDGVPHRNLSHNFYTDFSLWDTYRTTHPLYTLFYPDVHRDLLWSLARMTIEGQGLPRWPLGSSDSETMLGTPANIVLGESYLKGIRGFDEATFTPLAIEMVLGNQEMLFGSPPSPEDYAQLGYYPDDEIGRSVAWTQESSVSDYSLHHLAMDFSSPEVAENLKERGQNFLTLFDPQQGYFVGKNRDGSFAQLESPAAWDSFYAEGNARQYLWMAPHHPNLLIEALGGREDTLSRLDETFEGAVDEDEDNLGLPKPWYWHGNEPSLHVPWLYSLAGDHESTAFWVRWALDTQYANSGDGLPGNDDGGTMSAWVVWASIGLYPIVGTDRYVASPPIFSRVDIDNGQRRIQITHENGPSTGLWINDSQSNTFELRHHELNTLSWISPEINP
jgi:predicted alpha-1,2-mannosidase